MGDKPTGWAQRPPRKALGPGRSRDVGPPCFLEGPRGPERHARARYGPAEIPERGQAWGGSCSPGTESLATAGVGERGNRGRLGLLCRRGVPGARRVKLGLEAAPGRGSGLGARPAPVRAYLPAFRCPGREFGVMVSVFYHFSQLCKQSVFITGN